MKRALAAVVVALGAGAAGAAGQSRPADLRAFVSCPIVRDTPTVPCFLAEYGGETYFLGIQQEIQAEFRPPQLSHRVLVEGAVAPGPRVCGGIPLTPVRLSPLREIDRACSVMLPAEDGIEAPPAPRGPGPSSHQPVPGERPAPPPLGREVDVLFEFGSDFITLQSTTLLERVAAQAQKNGAVAIDVIGARGATRLSDGTTITEPTGLARSRATRVGEILSRMQTAPVKVTWSDAAVAGDALSAPGRRRVRISMK